MSKPDPEYDSLLERNRAWAARVQTDDPEFFERSAEQQTPRYLWVGCSDARTPASKIINTAPGEMFVHRNIGNLVVHTDLNALSVIQYAVDVLKVRHILVVGHYGCGGVRAVLERKRLGLVDNWLRHIDDVRKRHACELEGLPDAEARLDRLCELNVVEQAINVCRSTVVRDAWWRGQTLSVHGWIYNLTDGLIHDLGLDIDCDGATEACQERVSRRALFPLMQDPPEDDAPAS